MASDDQFQQVGEDFALHDEVLLFITDDDGQNEPVAVVVAETLEQATNGAHLLQSSVRYEAMKPDADFEGSKLQAYTPEKMMGRPIDTHRGDAIGTLEQAKIARALKGV